MSAPSVNRFERDTAVVPAGANRFHARFDPGWSVVGPNGGYIAAIALRALEASVADPARAPRSLNLHYIARPESGPVDLEARIERRGRSLTTATLRMVQDERLVCLAIGAFSLSRGGLSFDHAQMPEVSPPEQCEPMERRVEVHQRYECRWALGPQPFTTTGGQALCGGWIRLAEPRIVDAPLVAAYTDAFPPAIFAHAPRDEIGRGVPTIDLTIHFRRSLPLANAGADDFVLAFFRTRQVSDGFLEEDGEVWSRDGVLLAQSRQLALVV